MARVNGFYQMALSDKNLIITAYLIKKYKDSCRKYYDLNFNIIRDFPSYLILGWIKDKITVSYDSGHLHIEVIKYIFYANSHMDQVDEKIQEEIKGIKNKLFEIANKPATDNWQYRYNLSNLHACYILLENYEGIILNLIDVMYLDDAQDDLLYGIYQLPSKELAAFIKKLLLKLDYQKNNYKRKESFDPTKHATGALYDILKIFKKLYLDGYNLLNDAEIKEMFNYVKRNGEESNHLDRLQEKLNSSDTKRWRRKISKKIKKLLK